MILGNKIVFFATVYSLLIILVSCGSDADPGGQIWWSIIGFPLLGIAYVIGGVALSRFQENPKDSPEPVTSIIAGAFIMFIVYLIFIAIF